MQQDSLQWVPSAFALSSVCRFLLLHIHDTRFMTSLQELFLPSLWETRGSVRPKTRLPHRKRMDVYIRTCVWLCKKYKPTACSQSPSRRRRRGIHNCLCEHSKKGQTFTIFHKFIHAPCFRWVFSHSHFHLDRPGVSRSRYLPLAPRAEAALVSFLVVS